MTWKLHSKWKKKQLSLSLSLSLSLVWIFFRSKLLGKNVSKKKLEDRNLTESLGRNNYLLCTNSAGLNTSHSLLFYCYRIEMREWEKEREIENERDSGIEIEKDMKSSCTINKSINDISCNCVYFHWYAYVIGLQIKLLPDDCGYLENDWFILFLGIRVNTIQAATSTSLVLLMLPPQWSQWWQKTIVAVKPIMREDDYQIVLSLFFFYFLLTDKQHLFLLL